MTAAIAGCIETFVGRAVLDRFRVSFGVDTSPADAKEHWDKIVEVSVTCHIKRGPLRVAWTGTTGPGPPSGVRKARTYRGEGDFRARTAASIAFGSISSPIDSSIRRLYSSRSHSPRSRLAPAAAAVRSRSRGSVRSRHHRYTVRTDTPVISAVRRALRCGYALRTRARFACYSTVAAVGFPGCGSSVDHLRNEEPGVPLIPQPGHRPRQSRKRPAVALLPDTRE